MRKGFIAAGLTVAMLSGLLVLAVPARAATIEVFPGDSIQEAIHQAQPGDTVLVHAGTYEGSVSIHKSGIDLVGEGTGETGTTIVPGSDQQVCGHGIFGICVGNRHGAATDVHITGFTVTGFPVFGIIGFGTRGMVIESNALIDDGEYGAAVFGGVGTKMRNNVASGNAIGLYIGDSPRARAEITGNTLVDNEGFGLFLRAAAVGEVAGNRISGNCVGIFLLNEGTITTAGWNIHGNAIVKNNDYCPASREENSPAFSGAGIVVLAGDENRIAGNEIRRNRPSGRVAFSGGIILASEGSDLVPDRNRFVGNDLISNAPNVLWDGSGHHNVFIDNHCVGAC